MDVLDHTGRERVDNALQTWRQGDCVVAPQWFLFRASVACPLTEAGAIGASEFTDAAEDEVVGFIVVTQTCDLVRSCSERPFIEVSPLVEVERTTLHEIERGYRPRYAFIAGLAQQRFVADLDRVMTVEKSVVAEWERTPGCREDADMRRLSLALARKRSRVAFPDDFVEFAEALMERMSGKHDRASMEGRALRALREIRARAAPSWWADEVRLTFWFIREEDEIVFEQRSWDEYLSGWLGWIPASGRFVRVDGVVQTLDDLTARDYVESDPLDLDHLSVRGERAEGYS